ncbi:hypothetical protein C0992_012106 [Termitomyces sp. T32_za158]|nr:hypothetical protein C0992_012106 [Termitomyces sp. T32_za158]
MVLYPGVQVRAQGEIDAVIGTDRLPEFEDRKNLPYLESILQEVLRYLLFYLVDKTDQSSRWNHAAPAGVPHRALEADVYRGMTIPKDATIITNIRAMTLDESVYEDATTFDPTRFLPAPEGRNEPPTTVVYGFGHRKCPGRFLADENLWIAIATILATASISPAIGTDGKEIIPEATVVASGITTHPKPFACRIEPRSHEASKVLAHYIDSVQ